MTCHLATYETPDGEYISLGQMTRHELETAALWTHQKIIELEQAERYGWTTYGSILGEQAGYALEASLEITAEQLAEERWLLKQMKEELQARTPHDLINNASKTVPIRKDSKTMTDSAYQPTVVLPEFRLSFPKLIMPDTYQGKQTWGWTAIFYQGTDLTEVRNCVKEAAVRKWGTTPDKVRSFKTPFRDNSEMKGDEAKKPGKFIIVKSEYAKPGSKQAIQFVGPKLEPIDPMMVEDVFYAGCFCRGIAVATPWIHHDKETGAIQRQGVSFRPVKLQFAKDGDAFGATPDPNAELETLDTDLDLGAATDAGDDTPPWDGGSTATDDEGW